MSSVRALNRVLLIEDNPGDARLVMEYLRDRFGDDCDLREVNTLALGLDCLQATAYDVILLDLGLPDSTGLRTFFEINARAPSTPVVILTGDDDDELAHDALSAGAGDYLVKQAADSQALSRAMRHAVQRKALAARLRESEANLRAIVETAEEGIVQLSQDGRIGVTNARAARLLVPPIGGRSAASESLSGRSFYEFVEPLQVAALQDLLATVQGQRQSRELQLRCDDGTLIWVMAAATRAPLSPGSPGDLVLMLTDITDRRLAEAELQALRVDFEARVDERTSSLQALNADLEAFSVSVAHDLRTPLNGILGFAALMQIDQQHPLAAPQAQRLHIIEQSARSMDELIGGLLQLARLGRQAMVIEPLDLSAKALLIVRSLEASVPVREVNWQIDPGLAAPGDSRLVEVLLSNLLGNAWKYSAQVANASIHFGVLASPKSAPTFFVRDNGIGFDPTEAGELFTPFHRLPSASAYVGSGIGLATVRRVIERHGGRVWADSRPGTGACFYFTLEPDPGPALSP